MPKFYAHILTLALLSALDTAQCDRPIRSCSQTPYPQLCSSMISPPDHRSHHHDKSGLGFRNSALRATADRATHIHRLASSTSLTSLDPQLKTAWDDCLELYQDTIELLNLSMAPSSTHADTHTWLSAASTNQETCRDGYAEVNSLSAFRSTPFFANNLSESLSNVLAIQKAMTPGISRGNRTHNISLDREYPDWVSASDVKRIKTSKIRADLVVAQDGSGNFRTIREAIEAASAANRTHGSPRFVIYIKAGIYKDEDAVVPISLKNLMIVGDGIYRTIVTGSKNSIDGGKTMHSATFTAEGWGFIAKDMTFENTAGPAKRQAVAFRSVSDHSVYHHCSFKGYQDTLYVHKGRQFYRDCQIYGTIDFIFGNANAVFQKCNIFVRKPLSKQENIITAQSKDDPSENTGIVIHDSVIGPADDLAQVPPGTFKTYLGRPWKAYSTTVVMKTELGSLIDPAGWLEWNGNPAPKTLYYGEYMNTGPGADTAARVKWTGYHVLRSPLEVAPYTVRNFFQGEYSWIREAGVPFWEGI